jgi:uncharacterized membrane protein (UPF0127 family)
VLCTSTVIFGRHGPYLEMRRFRFARSLVVEWPGGDVSAWVAESFAQRLLGLAGLAAIPADRGLLIPECAAVQTWGMRFAIDIAFLEWPPGPGRGVIRLREAVGPGRAAGLRGRRGRHTAVLEAPAGALRELAMGPGFAAVTFKACPHRT